MTEKQQKETTKAATLTLRQYGMDDDPEKETNQLESLVKELMDEQQKWKERLNEIEGKKYQSPEAKPTLSS